MSKMFRTFKSPTPPARVPLKHLPGCIGVVSGDRSTHWQFAASLVTTAAPGSFLIWQAAAGGMLAASRNAVVEQALARGAAWIWWIDDDHVFPSDTLMRLLAHDRDICLPLISRRTPPHDPCVFAMCPAEPDMTDEQLIAAANLAQLDTRGHRGLVEMGSCGASGSLVRAEVYRKTPRPWYEFGLLGPSGGAEDTVFGLRARRAGFQIWCDLETKIGHLTTTAVWPTRKADGSIGSELRFKFGDVAGA